MDFKSVALIFSYFLSHLSENQISVSKSSIQMHPNDISIWGIRNTF